MPVKRSAENLGRRFVGTKMTSVQKKKNYTLASAFSREKVHRKTSGEHEYYTMHVIGKMSDRGTIPLPWWVVVCNPLLDFTRNREFDPVVVVYLPRTGNPFGEGQMWVVSLRVMENINFSKIWRKRTAPNNISRTSLYPSKRQVSKLRIQNLSPDVLEQILKIIYKFH